MSRPRKTIRAVDTHLMLPEDLLAEINLLLFSSVQGRVPLGALSGFFERAARKELIYIKEAMNVPDFSQG